MSRRPRARASPGMGWQAYLGAVKELLLLLLLPLVLVLVLVLVVVVIVVVGVARSGRPQEHRRAGRARH
eukprot:16446480-Heterocapsa_arctica.AAC.1